VAQSSIQAASVTRETWNDMKKVSINCINRSQKAAKHHVRVRQIAIAVHQLRPMKFARKWISQASKQDFTGGRFMQWSRNFSFPPLGKCLTSYETHFLNSDSLRCVRFWF
jgi:hypothetical protein